MKSAYNQALMIIFSLNELAFKACSRVNIKLTCPLAELKAADRVDQAAFGFFELSFLVSVVLCLEATRMWICNLPSNIVLRCKNLSHVF